jgi:DNA-binding transcriptional LysR family regulator
MGSAKKATSENLLAVLALHEGGSYGAAANAIKRDSATVKYHLMAARQAYDDDVLAYTSKGWQPTAKGLQILELAHKARLLKDALGGFEPKDAEPGTGPASEDAA